MDRKKWLEKGWAKGQHWDLDWGWGSGWSQGWVTSSSLTMD